MAPQLPTQLINLIMRFDVEQDNEFTIRFRVLFNGEDETAIIALLPAATRLLGGVLLLLLPKRKKPYSVRCNTVIVPL
jgi:hypothetical protein